MGNSILKLLYSESGEENLNICDVCGKHVDSKELEICPHCNRRIKLPTLQEYGKRLPVGILQDDQLLKEFDIDVLNWGKEKKISALMSSNEWKKRLTLVNYIGMILAHTVTNVGGVDISKFSVDKKINLFKEMYQGDVFYMYAYLRLITNGPELTLQNIECTNNPDHKFGAVVDVSAMKIMNIETVGEMKREFELETGILLEKEYRKKITIMPSKWNVLSIGANGSEAELMERSFLNSVEEIEGFPSGLPFTENILEELSKNDANIIEENLLTMHTGPLWTVELKCPQCEQEMFWVIDWTFKDFFTSSYTLGRK